jgi:uncharacterized BrkB/YihY/UPF0761 family membrane protein
MKLKISSIIYAIIGILAGFLYISNVRPVGWFDSVFGIFIAIVVFILLKRVKGILWK